MEQSIMETRLPRAELMGYFDKLLSMKVIYLHAPAGFGKTVSTQLWLAHRESLLQTRWVYVCLDEHDNMTSEFCRRFVFALASFQPDNESLRELVANPAFTEAPVEFVLRSLGACLESREECYLVFDDLHVIQNDEILRLLPMLVKRLPGNITVVLLSRAALPDSFSDMALKDELFIVDSEHLQFSSGEIKEFFHSNGHSITTKQADEILASTGGWAIGIRTLLLSDVQTYSYRLTSRHLDRFLRQHVWGRWDERLRRFMMLVSIAEELTPELCDWLTAGEELLATSSSEEILASLAYEKAYLRTIGPHTYRFHDLFRDFLMIMLGESGENAISGQWNRAGDYCFEKNNYHRAIECYTKAKNDDDAAKAIYRGMYNYKTSPASVEDTLRILRFSVNDSLLEKHPFMLESLVWCSFVEGQTDEFEKFADRYFRMYSEVPDLDVRAVSAHALFHCIDYRVSMIKVFEMLSQFHFEGDIGAATPTLTHNMPFFHRSNRDFSEILLDPERNMYLTEQSIGVIIGREFAVLKECLVSGFLFERGFMVEAYRHALEACANINEGCNPEVRFCALMILAAVLDAEGNEADANRVLGDVDEMIERNSAFYLSANLRAFKCRRKLAVGDEEAAREWLANYNRDLYDVLTFFEIYQHFTTARAFITVGDNTRAVLILQKLLRLSERYRRPLDVIESRILLSIAYWKKGRGGQLIALEHLEQAVLTANVYGYTQLFANEGPELVAILQRLVRRTAQKDGSGGDLYTFARSALVAASSKRGKGLTGGRVPEGLAFTDKQKTILRLMRDGYNRNEIAEKTGVKPYTVKSHIGLIYKKLNVSNRFDANAKAKDLGILDE